jgi:hypothetical protein
MPKSDSDPSLNPILELLKDVKKNIRDLNHKFDTTNRELGGIQVSLVEMRKHGDVQDRRIETVSRVQSDCQAKSGIKGVNARLRRLEEGTGSVAVPIAGTMPDGAVAVMSDGVMRLFFSKMIVPLLFAFVVGIGITAIVFWSFFQK